jgi:hypothetical protein
MPYPSDPIEEPIEVGINLTPEAAAERFNTT